MTFINILSMVLKFIPLEKCFHYKEILRKIILYSISFIFLLSFYVFGCIAFYKYLVPYWGEALAAFSLCMLSLFLCLTFILSARLLKAKQKKKSPPDLLPLLEKSLDQMLVAQELTKVLRQTSPKTLVIVLGAVALASYGLFCKNKK